MAVVSDAAAKARARVDVFELAFSSLWINPQRWRCRVSWFQVNPSDELCPVFRSDRGSARSHHRCTGVALPTALTVLVISCLVGSGHPDSCAVMCRCRFDVLAIYPLSVFPHLYPGDDDSPCFEGLSGGPHDTRALGVWHSARLRGGPHGDGELSSSLEECSVCRATPLGKGQEQRLPAVRSRESVPSHTGGSRGPARRGPLPEAAP